jgi:hypothetical protein
MTAFVLSSRSLALSLALFLSPSVPSYTVVCITMRITKIEDIEALLGAREGMNYERWKALWGKKNCDAARTLAEMVSFEVCN